MNPAKILAGTVNGSTTLMIATTAVVPPAPRHQDPWTPVQPWPIAATFAALLFILAALRGKLAVMRVRPAYLALILVAIATATIVGCSSANMSTPKGPSTATVTATSGGVTRTATININVQ